MGYELVPNSDGSGRTVRRTPMYETVSWAPITSPAPKKTEDLMSRKIDHDTDPELEGDDDPEY